MTADDQPDPAYVALLAADRECARRHGPFAVASVELPHRLKATVAMVRDGLYLGGFRDAYGPVTQTLIGYRVEWVAGGNPRFVTHRGERFEFELPEEGGERP